MKHMNQNGTYNLQSTSMKDKQHINTQLHDWLRKGRALTCIHSVALALPWKVTSHYYHNIDQMADLRQIHGMEFKKYSYYY